MDLNHSKSDSLMRRLRRRRREIVFATLLTFAAAGYLFSSTGAAPQKAPVALKGELKKVE